MSIRNYAVSIGVVYLFVGGDIQILRTLAETIDASQLWRNPDDFMMSSLSSEIRSRETLVDLACMYRRLKAGTSVHEDVFNHILLKMFWICSTENTITA